MLYPKKITLYQTSDGHVFDIPENAMSHAYGLDNKKINLVTYYNQRNFEEEERTDEDLPWSEMTLSFMSDGEVKEFYLDSVCYGAKITFTQPLPRGTVLHFRLTKRAKIYEDYDNKLQ